VQRVVGILQEEENIYGGEMGNIGPSAGKSRILKPGISFHMPIQKSYLGAGIRYRKKGMWEICPPPRRAHSFKKNVIE
jgi:hypothetical protein